MKSLNNLECVTLFVDDSNLLGIRKEDANDGRVIFYMRAEIAERIGMATAQYGVGLVWKLSHAGTPSSSTRRAPFSATRSQSGRWASSYSIS